MKKHLRFSNLLVAILIVAAFTGCKQDSLELVSRESLLNLIKNKFEIELYDRTEQLNNSELALIIHTLEAMPKHFLQATKSIAVKYVRYRGDYIPPAFASMADGYSQGAIVINIINYNEQTKGVRLAVPSEIVDEVNTEAKSMQDFVLKIRDRMAQRFEQEALNIGAVFSSILVHEMAHNYKFYVDGFGEEKEYMKLKLFTELSNSSESIRDYYRSYGMKNSDEDFATIAEGIVMGTDRFLFSSMNGIRSKKCLIKTLAVLSLLFPEGEEICFYRCSLAGGKIERVSDKFFFDSAKNMPIVNVGRGSIVLADDTVIDDFIVEIGKFGSLESQIINGINE